MTPNHLGPIACLLDLPDPSASHRVGEHHCYFPPVGQNGMGNPFDGVEILSRFVQGHTLG